MAILKNMSVAGGAASNIAPTYVDGTMFANDNEFYLYGFVCAMPIPNSNRYTDFQWEIQGHAS
jgi:hypothetical protein